MTVKYRWQTGMPKLKMENPKRYLYKATAVYEAVKKNWHNQHNTHSYLIDILHSVHRHGFGACNTAWCDIWVIFWINRSKSSPLFTRYEFRRTNVSKDIFQIGWVLLLVEGM